MNRAHHRREKRRFWGHIQARPVRYVGIAPALVTMLNGICGFASLLLASKAGSPPDGYERIALAGYMILLAMLADTLDGSLARISHTTSSFGGQLDSLCDMVSFGVAPAFLMLRVVHQGLSIQGLGHQTLYERFVLLGALTYLCCTAIRLARFNIEHM
ncbi:MAG: CDP-alcohol phosphatidyltransferase family protein, partial [Sedimentisphaerales bacterium]|nr:CDP-alcohol phosphatidyltransferase family protein [Sedimentisphaerales bacterium]